MAWLLVAPLWAMATHNRAGEIIVCRLNGMQYQATIITYTKLSSIAADRAELPLDWGDGTLDTLARTNTVDSPQQDLRRNEYVGVHTYLGPGIYELVMEDPNRNGGVVNVPNSIMVPFTIKTQLVIAPNTGHNCSVRFLNPPIQDACENQPWIHNPAAYDPNGDSLSFEPVVCLGAGGAPIPGYQFPSPNYSIDPVSGTITWNAPSQQGEYNLAFRVREWRKVNNTWVNVGWVIRDMQVTVVPCDNRPPVIQSLHDTCVVAGTVLSFGVNASDPDPGQNVLLSAFGQPFVLPNSPATFVMPSPANPVTGTFTWNTNCSHVRLQPYQVVFSAADQAAPVTLHDNKAMTIRIVAPAPQNPSATPSGSVIELAWDPSVCSNATGYAIYRRQGLYGYSPDHCETGVPAYTGYSYIGGTTGWNNSTYTDNGPLAFGTDYCYMVVALFAGGAESYASVEFCAMLDRQVPLITKVSVGVTDVSAGVDTVQWTNAYDLDTIARPGPYQFRLYRGTGTTTANELIWTSPLHPFLAHPDTTFIDQGLDTRNTPHVYRVELLGNGGNDVIGSGTVASSVFIQAAPNDEQVTLSWAPNVPWSNTQYEVFRFEAGSWVPIGTTPQQSFTDTGLENGEEYCYLVISTGAYSDPDITAPLVNWSQEVCAIPIDLTPPCTPTVALDNDCEAPLNTLTWTNPVNACGDIDTYQYNVYFTDSLGGTPVLIATITGASDTVFTHTDGSSVAGCYVVTALDSLGNESPFSEQVCGDNCPEYTLPNIFTPNGDRINDLFGPFPYRGVKAIDLTVHNRWGQVVFTATDPDIDWHGTYMDTNEPLPDGVYYYVCQVYFKRLSGEEAMVLKGYVHINGSGAPARMN